MEFIRPHAGAVLIYDPSTRRVRLWPFGAGRFPELHLRPDNPLIRNARGQRVDHSDVGSLLDNVRALRQDGKMKSPGAVNLAGRPVRHIDVTGANDFTVAGVHRYQLRLLTEMTLARLTPTETATLAAQHAGRALAVEQAAELYQHTEGNPLFVVEMVRVDVAHWAAGGERAPSATGANALQEIRSPGGSLPDRVQAVIQARARPAHASGARCSPARRCHRSLLFARCVGARRPLQ